MLLNINNINKQTKNNFFNKQNNKIKITNKIEEKKKKM